MKTRRLRYNVIGKGYKCNICGEVMERREHNEKPTKTWFFTKWDNCRNKNCPKTTQHYDEFKSAQWQEDERQKSFLGSI